MYKISDKAIKFIMEAMINLSVEFIARRKNLAEVKNQRDIDQRDALLQSEIAMMPLNHILTKMQRYHTFTKPKEKIRYLMYMDDI